MFKNFYISATAQDLLVFPVRKAGLKMLFLLCKKNITTLKDQLMSKVLTKRENGGYCRLLTRFPKENIIDVIKEAFTAYDGNINNCNGNHLLIAVFAPHKTATATRDKNTEQRKTG